MELLSFVIPCYNSSNTIRNVVDEIKQTVDVLGSYDYEVLLVNDCSKDNVYEVICELCHENSKIKAINLSKNFGQGSAIMAGLNHVKGSIVTLLDDDGQIPIDELPKLLDKIQEGYDVVYGQYGTVKQNIVRNFGSKVNEFMARTLIGKPKDLYISSFFVCKRYIIDEVVKYKNPYPYMYGLILRVTRNITNVQVTHRKRQFGKSNYTLLKLFSLWMNGFTAFSVKPLRIASLVGVVCTCVGVLYGLYIIIHRLLNPAIPAGYSSLMAVLLFIGGMIMLMLGMIGEYVGRIYISINNSPQYVIRQTINLEEGEKQQELTEGRTDCE